MNPNQSARYLTKLLSNPAINENLKSGRVASIKQETKTAFKSTDRYAKAGRNVDIQEDTTKEEDATNEKVVNEDTANEGASNEEGANQDTTNEDTAQGGAANEEALRKPVNENATNEDTANEDAINEDTTNEPEDSTNENATNESENTPNKDTNNEEIPEQRQQIEDTVMSEGEPGETVDEPQFQSSGPTAEEATLTCDVCERHCKSKAGLSRHRKVHEK